MVSNFNRNKHKSSRKNCLIHILSVASISSAFAMNQYGVYFSCFLMKIRYLIHSTPINHFFYMALLPPWFPPIFPLQPCPFSDTRSLTLLDRMPHTHSFLYCSNFLSICYPLWIFFLFSGVCHKLLPLWKKKIKRNLSFFNPRQQLNTMKMLTHHPPPPAVGWGGGSAKKTKLMGGDKNSLRLEAK